MANQIQIEMKTRINNAKNEDPDFAAGRKTAFIAVTAMLLTRVLLIAAEIPASVVNGLPFSMLQIVMLGMSLMFANLIYNGFKVFAILALMGGIWSAATAFGSEVIFAVFTYGNIFTTIYGILFILAIIMTILPMSYLLLNPKYKNYAKRINEIRKTVSEEQKKSK